MWTKQCLSCQSAFLLVIFMGLQRTAGWCTALGWHQCTGTAAVHASTSKRAPLSLWVWCDVLLQSSQSASRGLLTALAERVSRFGWSVETGIYLHAAFLPQGSAGSITSDYSWSWTPLPTVRRRESHMSLHPRAMKGQKISQPPSCPTRRREWGASCRDKKVPTHDGPGSSAHSVTADSDAPVFLSGNANGLPLDKVDSCISLQRPSLLLLVRLPNFTCSGWNRFVPRISSFGKFQ